MEVSSSTTSERNEAIENVNELMLAAEAKDFGRVTKILEKNQELITANDSTGKVALHYSAEAGNIKVFRKLYDADPSLIDHTDRDGYTPLDFAVIGGNPEIVQFLLDKGADANHVDAEKHSLVHWATVCARPDLLETLLRSGSLPSTPDINGSHPLHYATQLFSGPDAKRGAEILHILLKDGANVNCGDEDGRSPLLWASSSGSKEAFLTLIQAGADKFAVDKDQLTVLHCAASRGHAPIIDLMFQLCADLSADPQDRNGATPLFYAVTLGHCDCTKLLLHHGANPNHQDRKCRAAAHCGAAKGQLGTLKVVQQFGASFQLQNYRGDLPLHEAVQTGTQDVVQWLLGVHSSTLNAANHEGRTPLHVSAAVGNLELCQLFCETGANVNPLMLLKGELATPLDLAQIKEHQEVINYLKEQEGKSARDLPERLRRASKEFLESKVAEAKSTRPVDFTSTDFSSDGAKGRSNSLGRKQKRRTSSRTKNRTQSQPKMLKDTSTNTESERAEEIETTLPPIAETSGSSNLPDSSRTDPAPGDDAKSDDTLLLSSARTHEAPPIDENNEPKTETAHKIRFRLVDSLNASQSSNSDVTVEIDSATARKFKKTGNNTKRFLEEKRIFQELANLKRIQIQYGKVQESQLVKGLMENYLHHYPVQAEGEQFRLNTFSAWEKFLYDQLKQIYEEQRKTLTDKKAKSRRQMDFHKRLSRPPPRRNEARIDQLIKTYGVAPLPMQYSRKAKLPNKVGP